MPVSFSDLQLAFEFVTSGGMGENEAYLDRQSGKIYWHSEFGDAKAGLLGEDNNFLIFRASSLGFRLDLFLRVSRVAFSARPRKAEPNAGSEVGSSGR